MIAPITKTYCPIFGIDFKKRIDAYMQEVLKIYRYIYNSENNKINNTHRFLSLIFSGLGFFDFFFFFCLSSYFLMKSQIIENY